MLKFLKGKIVSLPVEDQLKDEVRHLVILRQLYNLGVIDVVEGRLSPEITFTPALTRELKFELLK